MISTKMLFILLVLIYVSLSHEEDPEEETKSFSLQKATAELKKLVNENLKEISNYGEEVKGKLKEWKNRNAKDGNVEEDINDLELILNNSITNYFKEKENSLYNKLLNLTNSKEGNIKEKFEKLYEEAKNIFDDGQKYWKNQWNGATDLFKSGVKKSPMTVDQKEVGETDKQQSNKTFSQRFNFLRKIPINLRKIFREQVEKLKRLAKMIKEKIVKKVSTSKPVMTVTPQISNITVEHRPPVNQTKSKEEEINLHPVAVHKTYQVDKIINNNIETLTDLWTQSKDKDFHPPNFSEVYDDTYNEVNKLIQDIPINK